MTITVIPLRMGNITQQVFAKIGIPQTEDYTITVFQKGKIPVKRIYLYFFSRPLLFCNNFFFLSNSGGIQENFIFRIIPEMDF